VVEETASPGRIPSYRGLGALRLVAAIRLAFDPRKVAIAALGLLILQVGWAIFDILLPASAGVTPDLFGPPPPVTTPAEGWNWLGERATASTLRLSEPIRLLTTPLRILLDPASEWGAMLHALLGLVWLAVVWGVCGGAIARLAVIQEAQMRQPGIGEAIRFALRSAATLIVAPLCPLFGMAFCSLVGVAFGLLYRVPYGAAVAGAGLILPLAAGLVMTLLAAGLVAGWPLLHAALAAGADDALDALSRTFSYLNQRLGLFVAGVGMAWLAGLVGLVGVDLLAEGVIRLTQWSLSLSGGRALPEALFWHRDLAAGTAAAATHGFWLGLVRLLAHGWTYSFVWTAGAFLYLWLRQEVDGTPWTEIDPVLATPAPSPGPSAAVPRLQSPSEIS
jgi:hypothetical protein